MMKFFVSYRRDDSAAVQLWQRTRWAVGALVPAALIGAVHAFFPSPIPDIAFVEIPAGTFQMGSHAENMLDDEQPVHTVTITKPFSMSIYEITQGQWKQVMGTEPWVADQNVQEGDDYPASYVSWYNADAFARQLDSLSGTHHYRLPTEAEWEYAARAGSTTEYWFGDEADSLGQKRPNRWGLYDMHGNVWEWVLDWYGDYPSGAVTDPKGSESGSRRVFRGGSWGLTARGAPSAYRNSVAPDFRDFYLGFRLVRTEL